MDHVSAINDAATALREAIDAAYAAGYRVDFPRHALEGVGISETARAARPEPQPEAQVFGQASEAAPGA